MQRDLTLVREILLALESREHGYADGIPVIEGFSKEQVGYHVYLMGQAGLLEIVNQSGVGDLSPSARPLNMTWEGHDFLAATKVPTVWEQTKDMVLKPAGQVGFDLLKLWLKTKGAEVLKLP